MDKETLRREALHRRDAMAEEERMHLSQSLEHYCAQLPDAKIVAAFWPIRSEIDPRPLMFSLAQRGASLALPAILPDRGMVFRHFSPGDHLVKMAFSTFAPGEEAASVIPDLILMPLAAFDRAGNRIGYGAGYYDRALAALHAQGKRPYLIGLAFDCQKVDVIAAEAHDVPLSAVLTESGLHNFNQKSD